jgi:hypothetical protein
METREEEEVAGRSVVIAGAAGGIGIVLPGSEDAAFITGQMINVSGGAEFH